MMLTRTGFERYLAQEWGGFADGVQEGRGRRVEDAEGTGGG